MTAPDLPLADEAARPGLPKSLTWMAERRGACLFSEPTALGRYLIHDSGQRVAWSLGGVGVRTEAIPALDVEDAKHRSEVDYAERRRALASSAHEAGAGAGWPKADFGSYDPVSRRLTVAYEEGLTNEQADSILDALMEPSPSLPVPEDARAAALREVVEPFSVMAGELFARNYNASDVVLEVGDARLTFDAFLNVRAALADPASAGGEVEHG